uniref:Calmodulin n=1 Tax=Percolomonas cosmopolitus TaxID=63605 RepID=A0A7S1KPM4_9EUKA|mmetsp:Transcript_4084/g.15364  ORF Transcript_4084/g.15364 Transcript_4084/m.15364 type:complete len:181 (+) Transcript_4084:132-674(+)
MKSGINSGNSNLPTEDEQSIETRVREVFPYLDAGRRKKDKKIDTKDLQYVLKKIKAPRSWIQQTEEILWEIDDNNQGYLLVDDLVRTVQRIMNASKSNALEEPSRVIDIIDFVSKDPKLTGKISARDCILLLHNRFGGSVNETRLRDLFMNSNFQKATTEYISFTEFCKQVKVRRMLKQR